LAASWSSRSAADRHVHRPRRCAGRGGQNVPTLALFQDYQAARERRHLTPNGDRLPVSGVDAVVVSSGGRTIAEPLTGAGGRNPACGNSARAAQEIVENPRSTGVLIQFGRFRFLDVGDLTGAPLFDLACPRDLIGPVDVYLVAHHGGADAADLATLAAFRPRVAVLDNGARKGAGPEMLTMLRGVAGLDSWQLHRSVLDGAANAPDERLANLDETTAHWIKVSAKDDGSFRMDMSYFNYCQGLTMTSAKFDALFGGPPRKSNDALTQRQLRRQLPPGLRVLTSTTSRRQDHDAHDTRRTAGREQGASQLEAGRASRAPRPRRQRADGRRHSRPDRFQPMRSAYLTLIIDSVAESERIYELLTYRGEIFMKMEETFFAKRFASAARPLRDVVDALLHEPAGN
jgi:hypothetical protein